MNFMFSWQEQYLTSERSERVRYCSYHSNIKFISSRHRVISCIYICAVALKHVSSKGMAGNGLGPKREFKNRDWN